MYKKVFRKFLSILLIGVFLFNLTGTAFATNSSDSESTKVESPTAQLTNTDVIWGDGYIKEQMTVNVNGSDVHIVRTTYSNNVSLLEITENGITTTATQEADYNALDATLRGSRINDLPVTRDRVSGYTYTYMKTVSQTEYYKAEYTTYSLLLTALNGLLTGMGVPGAAIATVASVIYSFNASAVDAKFVYYRHWYEVTETSSGAFISYYCEWSLHTYVKDGSGNWKYLDTRTGSFDSFNVY